MKTFRISVIEKQLGIYEVKAPNEITALELLATDAIFLHHADYFELDIDTAKVVK